MEKYLNDNQEFTVYWLSHADSNTVFNWLKVNKPKRKRNLFEAEREEIEKKLIERDEPLINLGLALYGNDKETGLNLFSKGDKTIQKAVLSGTTIRPQLLESWVTESGILKKLVNSFDEDLLLAFLSNGLIEDDVLVNLYEKKEPFEKLSDEKWYDLILYTHSNSRISTPYNETWMAPLSDHRLAPYWRSLTDGSHEYRYHLVFNSAWKLFDKLPVNETTAQYLAHLGERLVPDASHDMNVMETIQRWRTEAESKSTDFFELCRYELAGLIKEFDDSFKALKDSDDMALRRSYYRRFQPHIPEEIRKLFEKDNDKFLDEATGNLNLYKFEKIRDELSKCCWDYKDPHHDLFYPNIFNSRVELLEKEHPEWFKDWLGEIPLEKIDNPIERVNKSLEQLYKKLNIISEKLSDTQDQENRNKNLFDKIQNISNKLNELNSNSSNKKVYYWLFGIVGLVLGYFLAK